jgi:hypothetical protein
MTIELNDYGFMFDAGDFLYLSLSWAMIVTSTVIFAGYTFYKRKKATKWHQHYTHTPAKVVETQVSFYFMATQHE